MSRRRFLLDRRLGSVDEAADVADQQLHPVRIEARAGGAVDLGRLLVVDAAADPFHLALVDPADQQLVVVVGLIDLPLQPVATGGAGLGPAQQQAVARADLLLQPVRPAARHAGLQPFHHVVDLGGAVAHVDRAIDEHAEAGRDQCVD